MLSKKKYAKFLAYKMAQGVAHTKRKKANPKPWLTKYLKGKEGPSPTPEKDPTE
jgi:hypothetical protein